MLIDIAFAHQSSSALIQASVVTTEHKIEHIGGNQVAQINSLVNNRLSNVQFFMEKLQRSVQEGMVDAVNSYQQSNVQLSRVESQLSGLENLTRTIARDSSQPYQGEGAIEAIAQFRKGSNNIGKLEHCEEYLIRV